MANLQLVIKGWVIISGISVRNLTIIILIDNYVLICFDQACLKSLAFTFGTFSKCPV